MGMVVQQSVAHRPEHQPLHLLQAQFLLDAVDGIPDRV